MEQLIAEKFTTEGLHKDMDISEVILTQYGLTKNDIKSPIKSTDLYMPEEEQDKMYEWIIKNLNFGHSHEIIVREMPFVRLDIFPSSVRK